MRFFRILQAGKTRFAAVSCRLLRPVVRDVAADQLHAVERQCQDVLAQMKGLNERLTEFARRESQIRAILKRDLELEGHQARILEVLGKTDTSSHIVRAIRRGKLHHHPFPYAVIDDVLPGELYQCLLKGLPPLELFSDRPVNKQQLTVPFGLAPIYFAARVAIHRG